MTRKEFLRASALVAAGLIAADQLEILDRLAPRSLFASAKIPEKWGGEGFYFDRPQRSSMAVSAGDIIVYANPFGSAIVGRDAVIAVVRNGYCVERGVVSGISGNTLTVNWT